MSPRCPTRGSSRRPPNPSPPLRRDCATAALSSYTLSHFSLTPSPIFLWERVGERVQAGLPKAPRNQILLLHQCLRVSGSDRKPTPPPSPRSVRERASISASLSNSMRAIFVLQPVFRHSLIMAESI